MTDKELKKIMAQEMKKAIKVVYKENIPLKITRSMVKKYKKQIKDNILWMDFIVEGLFEKTKLRIKINL